MQYLATNVIIKTVLELYMDKEMEVIAMKKQKVKKTLKPTITVVKASDRKKQVTMSDCHCSA